MRFAGSIKRWGMKRGLMTHGSKSKRQHGSIGASATPSRVLPGLKMAGHMGNTRIKVRKVKVSGPACVDRVGEGVHLLPVAHCGSLVSDGWSAQRCMPPTRLQLICMQQFTRYAVNGTLLILWLPIEVASPVLLVLCRS